MLTFYSLAPGHLLWILTRHKKPGKMGKNVESGPQARNGRKMAVEMENGPRNGILAIFCPFFHFDCNFLPTSGLGPFSFFFPIFPGFLCRAGFPFCIWPLRSRPSTQQVCNTPAPLQNNDNNDGNDDGDDGDDCCPKGPAVLKALRRRKLH